MFYEKLMDNDRWAVLFYPGGELYPRLVLDRHLVPGPGVYPSFTSFLCLSFLMHEQVGDIV